MFGMVEMGVVSIYDLHLQKTIVNNICPLKFKVYYLTARNLRKPPRKKWLKLHNFRVTFHNKTVDITKNQLRYRQLKPKPHGKYRIIKVGTYGSEWTQNGIDINQQ